MMRRSPLLRSTPMARTSKPMTRRKPKRPAGYSVPKYLAACRGEPCFLNLPGCQRNPMDETVVPAHQNQGKGTGMKVPDRYTVPACHHCHSLYDQSGLDREYKRAAWDWAYTRWEPVRTKKIGAA